MQEILEKKNEFLKPHQSNQNIDHIKTDEKMDNSIDEFNNVKNEEIKSEEIELDDIRVQERGKLDDDLLQIPAFLRRQAN